jgi:hypothetical protein
MPDLNGQGMHQLLFQEKVQTNYVKHQPMLLKDGCASLMGF